jgi:hypothetical protein
MVGTSLRMDILRIDIISICLAFSSWLRRNAFVIVVDTKVDAKCPVNLNIEEARSKNGSI